MRSQIGFNFGLHAGSAAAAGGPTYATWNPADKDVEVELAGSDLIAYKAAGGGHVGVRATIGVTAGKWFYCSELTGAANTIMLGVALSSNNLGQYLGANPQGWGYYGVNGNKANNGSLTAYGSSYTVGDVIGIGIDADARTMEGFVLSGGAWVSQGLIDISGLVGALYPAASVYAGNPAYPTASGDIIETNFGASAFPATVPSGYNEGVYAV